MAVPYNYRARNKLPRIAFSVYLTNSVDKIMSDFGSSENINIHTI